MKIRENFYTLHDSISGLFGAESGKFYSFENSVTQLLHTDDLIKAQIEIVLDQQIDRYERTVQTLFEAIGTIGGIYEILRLSIGLIVKSYNYKVYEQATANAIKNDLEDWNESKEQSDKHGEIADEENKINNFNNDPVNHEIRRQFNENPLLVKFKNMKNDKESV